MRIFRRKLRRTREGCVVALISVLVGAGAAAGWAAYRAILEGR